MTYHYQIDPGQRLVSVVVTGELNMAMIRGGIERLRQEPEFDPSLLQLLDLRGVTTVSLSPPDLRNLVRTSPFGAGARRAAVTEDDCLFGIVRIYRAFDDVPGRKFSVFREIEDARNWLSLETNATAFSTTAP